MPKYKLKTAKESQEAATLRVALGATSNEKIEVIIPQFEREVGAPKPHCPPADFEALREMGEVALREMGCRAWNMPNDPEDAGKFPPDTVLMLFPGEWYLSIPEGYAIVDINGISEPFVRRESDNGIRFGVLAYGVLATGRSTSD